MVKIYENMVKYVKKSPSSHLLRKIRRIHRSLEGSGRCFGLGLASHGTRGWDGSRFDAWSGWWFWATPLENDGLRQLGWLEIHPIFMGTCQIHGNQTTQPVMIVDDFHGISMGWAASAISRTFNNYSFLVLALCDSKKGSCDVASSRPYVLHHWWLHSAHASTHTHACIRRCLRLPMIMLND